MNGFNEEVFIPEKIRSGANIPVKVSEVDLKAAESIQVKLRFQFIYQENFINHQ